MEIILDSHYLKVIPYLLKGLYYTLAITTIGLFFGCIIGTLFGLAKLAKKNLIRYLATIYVEVIRGTPLLAQILFIYFAVPDLTGIYLDRVPAAIIIIAINAGAYIAEIVRGGLGSIEQTQVEAGHSIGLTQGQTMLFIVWPQAFKRMLPPLGNQFIITLKDTSLFSIIAIQEFLFQARVYYSSTFAIFEALTMVCILYLLITIPLSIYLKKIERKQL